MEQGDLRWGVKGRRTVEKFLGVCILSMKLLEKLDDD